MNELFIETWKQRKTKQKPTFLDLQLMEPRPEQLSLIYHLKKNLILEKIIKDVSSHLI